MTPRSRGRRSKRPQSSRAGRNRGTGADGRAQAPLRGRASPEPSPSPRYTPSRPAFRIRPSWHKVLGWTFVALGVVIAVVNDIQWASRRMMVLPGGHSELYLVLAFLVAATGAWWLGVFDRPLS